MKKEYREKLKTVFEKMQQFEITEIINIRFKYVYI